jgi:LysR family glycine cleavage system transcriptional activator
MSRRMPNLTWLRAFEASARHLSFTNAAAELHLTQAAVSKQVKLLEQFFGELLFERRARSLAITKVGEAYLPKVRDGFARLEAGTTEVFGNRLAEVLTVRASIGFSVGWIAQRLTRYTEAHPNRPLRLVSSVWNENPDQALSDFDIRYGSGHWPGMVSDRLTWEVLEPLCAPSLLNTGMPLNSPDGLRHHCLLHVMGYEEGWATWISANGVLDISAGQGLQFDTSIMAMEFAANGGGIALGRSSMATQMLDSGRLVRPFSTPIPVDEAFYLTSPAGGRPHPGAAEFREWILAEAHADPENRRARDIQNESRAQTSLG